MLRDVCPVGLPRGPGLIVCTPKDLVSLWQASSTQETSSSHSAPIISPKTINLSAGHCVWLDRGYPGRAAAQTMNNS